MNQFPSLSSLVNKKELEIEETKPTYLLSTFKTHMTKMGFVFLLTKLLREGNWPLKKNTFFLSWYAI